MNTPRPKPYIADIPLYVPGKTKAGGHKLSSNENPLGCSTAALRAATERMRYPQSYPDGASVKLREAIGEREGLDPARIICGAGSDEIMSMICTAFLAAGDEIVQTQHGFLMYSIYARYQGAVTKFAPETHLTADVDAILEAITDQTKIVFLANPNNPTGTYLPHAEVVRLAESIPSNVLLVLDGAYAEYVTASDYAFGKALATKHDNLLILRTFSKIYGLAAFRVGWAYAHQDVIDTLNKVRSPFNVSAPAQAAAAAAIMDTDFISNSVRHNTTEGHKLIKCLTDIGIPYTKGVGNFVLAHAPDSETDFTQNLSDYLAANNLIVRQVAAYGLPNSVRISIGTTEANTALMAALSSFMASHCD